MKQVKIPINLNVSDYINRHTGEALADELKPGMSLRVTQDTKKLILESDDFITIDTKQLEYLRSEKIITKIDTGYIVTIAETLATDYNAAYNSSYPHTLESLSVLLDLSYERTSKLVTKLHKKNIIFKLVTADKTIYCMNPFLARKRKTIDETLLKVFSKFKK